jgi:hypothetical protein
MLNIHELAHKKVSLSSNVFVFFFSFLLQLSQTGIIKLSHSNYALIKYSNLSILSVPDEGYSRNALCALKLIFFLMYLFILQISLSMSTDYWADDNLGD